MYSRRSGKALPNRDAASTNYNRGEKYGLTASARHCHARLILQPEYRAAFQERRKYIHVGFGRDILSRTLLESVSALRLYGW
jgi:hypothetical protein